MGPVMVETNDEGLEVTLKTVRGKKKPPGTAKLAVTW